MAFRHIFVVHFLRHATSGRFHLLVGHGLWFGNGLWATVQVKPGMLELFQFYLDFIIEVLLIK